MGIVAHWSSIDLFGQKVKLFGQKGDEFPL